MMPLTLNEEQVLPSGVHDASLKDIKDMFGGFQRSDRRIKLFSRLEEYIGSLRQADIACSLIVDGSFIMGCIDEPEDIDVILVFDEAWDMSRDLPPVHYNLVSKRAIKKNFPFDVLLAREGSIEEQKAIDFFSKVNTKWYTPYNFAPGSIKGLVRIKI